MCGRVGTDIVSVARITRLLEDGGTACLERWFTSAEIAYCMSKAVPGRHLAARFAAKEALVKALATRWDGPLPWRSIEIVHDDRGAPSVRLCGPTADAAADIGAQEICVSLSHCDDYATATVIVSVQPSLEPAGAVVRT